MRLDRSAASTPRRTGGPRGINGRRRTRSRVDLCALTLCRIDDVFGEAPPLFRVVGGHGCPGDAREPAGAQDGAYQCDGPVAGTVVHLRPFWMAPALLDVSEPCLRVVRVGRRCPLWGPARVIFRSRETLIDWTSGFQRGDRGGETRHHALMWTPLPPCDHPLNGRLDGMPWRCSRHGAVGPRLLARASCPSGRLRPPRPHRPAIAGDGGRS